MLRECFNSLTLLLGFQRTTPLVWARSAELLHAFISLPRLQLEQPWKGLLQLRSSWVLQVLLRVGCEDNGVA